LIFRTVLDFSPLLHGVTLKKPIYFLFKRHNMLLAF
jgi:hypothetical protein